MSEAVQVALIVSIPATLASVASLIASLRNSGKLNEIHTATNGMNAVINAATAKSSHAEGMAAQREMDKLK